MAKTPLDKFSAEIAGILEEYADDVQSNLEEITKEVGKKGAKAVQAQAKATVGGKMYASGWTSQVEATRIGTTATIYNKARPGLAHLLEHGHVSRNGTGRTFGRVPGHEHIAPVEQELVDEFQKELEKRL